MATTWRCSSVKMLKVRQAAPESITSTPIPCANRLSRTPLAGHLSVVPVPSKTISGWYSCTVESSSALMSSYGVVVQSLISRRGIINEVEVMSSSAMG